MLVACRVYPRLTHTTWASNGAQTLGRLWPRPSLVASSGLAPKIRRMAANSKPFSAAPLTSLGNRYRCVCVGR